MRGEYASTSRDAGYGRELPPRARRILQKPLGAAQTHGTTSACAENTAYRHPGERSHRNYLRVRGEYSGHLLHSFNVSELPPRARRIPYIGLPHHGHGGTTSACAENTFFCTALSLHARNYLRVRGEYSLEDTNTYIGLELPPRARRIRGMWGFWVAFWGTTSACAENTTFHYTHPRPTGTTSACAENT